VPSVIVLLLGRLSVDGRDHRVGDGESTMVIVLARLVDGRDIKAALTPTPEIEGDLTCSVG
jgi:hypothetical protein